MSTVSVQCEGCGLTFERKKGEVTRSQKLGRQFFCSRQCLGKNRDNSRYKDTGHPQTLIAGNRRDDLTPFRWYMRSIRYRCQYTKKPLKETDLTIDDLVQQWTLQGGRCPSTGWNLVLPDSTVGWKSGTSPRCASVDRIDSSLGYIKGNIVFVAVIYNYAKNAFSDADVIDFCQAVANHTGALPIP
jgi:hypothetical protein